MDPRRRASSRARDRLGDLENRLAGCFGAVVGVPVGVATTVISTGTSDALTEPRHAPPALLPAAPREGIVLAIALPIFLLPGGASRAGPRRSALLGSEALGWVLTRLQSRTGNLAAAGRGRFGMLFRAIAVMVVGSPVAVSDKWSGWPPR